MDNQILSLYSKGMSTRDIVAAFDEMYGEDISPTLISQVTDAVIEQVIQWQNRPLDAVYPIIYLDCIVLKIKQDKSVINKLSTRHQPRWLQRITSDVVIRE
jgi:putative transposase